MRFRAILFDLDGTLVDTERESAEAMARALATGHGIQIGQPERDFIIGRSWVDIYDNLRRVHPSLSWSRDELIARTAAAREGVFAELGITVLPGAREAVGRFPPPPWRRALVTGSSRVEARQALEALGLAAAFDAVFASEDVARSKPAPDGYAAAAAALGVAPTQCVVVEDSAAGIAAGRAAGAAVVAVRAGNFHGQDQSGAHAVIETLEELTLDFLERL
jgi:beta-phosphoglucomutase-like phosphatase (HAD superfamily)